MSNRRSFNDYENLKQISIDMTHCEVEGVQNENNYSKWNEETFASVAKDEINLMLNMLEDN